MFYLTLDEALQDVANRSFYEDCKVTPLVMADDHADIRGYVVEDDISHATDEWRWSYDEGIHDRDSVSETSRLHDPCETYTHADHVRYNMPESVAALENGVPVTFAYAIVDDADVTTDDQGNGTDKDGYPADPVAGWIMIAIIWESEN